MTKEQLGQRVVNYVKTRLATHMAQQFHADPLDAAGEIYLRLASRIPADIRDEDKWFSVNARFQLRNYLILDAIQRSRFALSAGERENLQGHTLCSKRRWIRNEPPVRLCDFRDRHARTPTAPRRSTK